MIQNWSQINPNASYRRRLEEAASAAEAGFQDAPTIADADDNWEVVHSKFKKKTKQKRSKGKS
jgi:hypothetical protein